MIDADSEYSPPKHWQNARHEAAELLIELPQPAPGTHVYLATAGAGHRTVVLLRAFVRAATREGHRVKLL